LVAAAIPFIVGSLVDVLILWIFQRQPAAEWEFTALISTAEGLPRIALGLAFAYLAMLVRGSTSLIGYRLLALGLVAIGIAGAMIGSLMVTDYFILRASVAPEASMVFRSAVLKTIVLCGLYVFVLLPMGVLGLKRPKA
jgi:hypothetical protein